VEIRVQAIGKEPNMKQQINPIVSVAISRVGILLQQYQESAAIAHAATKGSLREAYLKQFLAESIPQPLQVGSGFVTDAKGHDVSPQIDLLIFDPQNIPAYSMAAFVTVVPIEAAVLAVEVKSSIAKVDFDQIRRHQVSFRKMRPAYTAEGRKYLTTTNCLGVSTMLIAFDTTCAHDSLAGWFDEEERLEAICVIGKFTMLRDPNSGQISTLKNDGQCEDALQLLARLHDLCSEHVRRSRDPISLSTPDGPRDFYPDLGAYLTYDLPAGDSAEGPAQQAD
jgi:hypothetical protein